MVSHDNKRFTATEQRIMDVLWDGATHDKYELHGCLPDPEADLDAVQMHLSNIRKKIRPKGLEILCVFRHRRRAYQLVRPITTGE